MTWYPSPGLPGKTVTRSGLCGEVGVWAWKRALATGLEAPEGRQGPWEDDGPLLDSGLPRAKGYSAWSANGFTSAAEVSVNSQVKDAQKSSLRTQISKTCKPGYVAFWQSTYLLSVYEALIPRTETRKLS